GPDVPSATDGRPSTRRSPARSVPIAHRTGRSCRARGHSPEQPSRARPRDLSKPHKPIRSGDHKAVIPPRNVLSEVAPGSGEFRELVLEVAGGNGVEAAVPDCFEHA